jgi:uncharacterized protein YxjI
MQYNYPLYLRFKLLTLAPKIYVADNSGEEILYVDQKLFRLKEEVRIFNNSKKEVELYTIKANQIMDIGAEYSITDLNSGKQLGSLKQEGLKTFWRASYLLKDHTGNLLYQIKEANPWVKVWDMIFGAVPLMGWLSNYFFHPKYNVFSASTEEVILTLSKKPSFFEKTFEIDKESQPVGEKGESLIILGLMMLVQLEKQRG